ncbi:LacI family DNA-binding transcriptional regulator [Parasegetibacter sp. NRK P23]|uniref:LacI family DNA-binding transcriptional regulator n=1 Tax=Parasegetibacter sp. NRK P23 TaxID=2942999 RepID=UPI00204320A1|nr:LacI family DNA-binding transcriptional regulator [Parasegetibacter sp. NRK P23]MCM5527295.1 LacI family transcriptional regulator [Parasegetibacter sp. NRK P23]
MKFEAVTIKDIAKALGLSTSTVSRALRDSHEISAETKQLVLDCAEKLNYRPNPIALSLKEKRSRSIGVVVCEIANNFFSQIINGIESIAYDRGYNVIISQSHESYEREVMDLHYLSSRSVDGLLISVSTETNDTSHIRALHEKGLPIVLFDRIADEIKTHTVVSDNFQGAYDATEHLIKNGYKKIAALTNSEFLSITSERLAGYREALLAHDIKPINSWVKHCFYGGMIFSEIEEAVNNLLTQKNKPDAIFTTSDKLTTGCLKTLIRRGIRVPDEIAVIGFSNTDIPELLNPSLSVIRQPAYEMGKAATELLLQLIESKRPVKEFEKRVLTPEIQIRDSSGGRKI